MKFIDKVTGNDITREYKALDSRMQVLPDDYANAWIEIKQCYWQHSDFTGRNILPVLERVVEILEETASHGQSIEEVLGDDIQAFCTELIGPDGQNTYRDKWRKQLNNKIKNKLEK